MSCWRNRSRLGAAVAAALLALGCGAEPPPSDPSGEYAGASQAAALPDRAPSYRGELTSVDPFEPITEHCVEPGERDPDEPVSNTDPPTCTDPDKAPLGAVLIEEHPGVQEGDKISVRIEQDTLIAGGADGEERLAFEDLAEGDRVQAWVDGPVANSYPQRGAGEALRVLE